MGREWGGHIVDQKETDWVGGGGDYTAPLNVSQPLLTKKLIYGYDDFCRNSHLDANFD